MKSESLVKPVVKSMKNSVMTDNTLRTVKRKKKMLDFIGERSCDTIRIGKVRKCDCFSLTYMMQCFAGMMVMITLLLLLLQHINVIHVLKKKTLIFWSSSAFSVSVIRVHHRTWYVCGKP